MNIAVLGGGVTGLTAAWRLSRAGHSVKVLEAGKRLGGSVRTDQVDGWTVEAGPNSFQESSPEIGALIGELGLGAERVVSLPAAKNRFIAARGRLIALPAGPGQFISTPLFSLGTKWRILREIARKPVARPEEASVSDFLGDHLGAELVERVVQPFVSGIFAGDPGRLSARHAFPKLWAAEAKTGSLVRTAIAGVKARRALGQPAAPQIVSFRRGLQALPDALVGQLPQGSVAIGAEVRSIGPGAGARWRVGWSEPGGERAADFDFVICALPAWALAGLEIGAGGDRPLSGLAEIEYPPVASVFLGYRRDQVRHPLDGFGALVAATEMRSVLGVLFSSSLFDGRAPAGHVALTAFAGGALQPEIARLPADELVTRVTGDVEALLGASGKPVFVRHALWPRAIPQYNVGYGRHLEAMERCERANPGLLIGGSVRDGISLPDCLLFGVSLANRAMANRPP